MREEVASHYRSKGYAIRERVQVRGRSGTVHAVEMVVQGPLGNLVVAFEDAGGFEGPELGAVRRIARDIGATPVVAARRFEERLRVQAAQSGVVLLDEAALQAQPLKPPAEPDDIAYPPWPDARPTRAALRPEEGASGTPDAEPAWAGQAPRTKSTDPGFWRYPRRGQAEAEPEHALDTQPDHVQASARPRATFDWLAPTQADAVVTGVATPALPRSGVRAAAAGTADAVRAPLRHTQASTPRAPAGTRQAPAASARQTPTGRMAQWIAAGAAFGASAGVVVYALLRLLG